MKPLSDVSANNSNNNKQVDEKRNRQVSKNDDEKEAYCHNNSEIWLTSSLTKEQSNGINMKRKKRRRRRRRAKIKIISMSRLIGEKAATFASSIKFNAMLLVLVILTLFLNTAANSMLNGSSDNNSRGIPRNIDLQEKKASNSPAAQGAILKLKPPSNVAIDSTDSVDSIRNFEFLSNNSNEQRQQQEIYLLSKEKEINNRKDFINQVSALVYTAYLNIRELEIERGGEMFSISSKEYDEMISLSSNNLNKCRRFGRLQFLSQVKLKH